MRRRDDRRYVLIARLMLLVAAVTIALWGVTDFSLFWVEASVFLLFMVFWTVQTFELESREECPATAAVTNVRPDQVQ